MSHDTNETHLQYGDSLHSANRTVFNSRITFHRNCYQEQKISQNIVIIYRDDFVWRF